MSDSPFRTTKAHLNATPVMTWGAVIASVSAALFLAALIPLVYLFVDHLVWKGRIPSYGELSPARQEAFRAEWDATGTDALGKREEALTLVRPARLEGNAPDAARWEWRWQATVYDALRSKIGPEAADAYLKARVPRAEGEDNTVATLTGNRLGVLSLIVRERPRWTASRSGRGGPVEHLDVEALRVGPGQPAVPDRVVPLRPGAGRLACR